MLVSPYFQNLSPLLLALALGIILGGCSSSSSSAGDQNAAAGGKLPAFPDYAPAKEFLDFQKRLAQYRKPPTRPPLQFNDRQRHIYKTVQRQQDFAKAELAYEAQQRREYERLRYSSSDGDYKSYQNRVAQLEVEMVQREHDTERTRDRKNQENFAVFQKRLESQQLEQQALQYLRDQQTQQLLRQSRLKTAQLGNSRIFAPPPSSPPAQ